MDNYPAALAPEFEESGAVKTPFEEWWQEAKSSFPTVPESVARYWLHEHWGHSPFGWLPSANYEFNLVNWLATDLVKIRSRWCNYEETNEKCRAHGEHLIKVVKKLGYRTAKCMDESENFPAPIVVLDHRDGHLERDGQLPSGESPPNAYMLLEGHRRFNIALYLQSIGRFVPTTSIWMLTRAFR